MLRRCKELHGKQKILKNADSNQRNRLGMQKLRWKRSKLSINETGCARYPESGFDAPRIRFLQFSEKQLLLDAPRIQWCAAHPRHLFDETLQGAVITGCATHQVKSTAGNALNDKLYSDAPCINRCVTHPNLALPEYKRDREQFIQTSPWPFPIRKFGLRLGILRSEKPFLHI